MFKTKRSIPVFLLCLAAIGLLFLSLGGEYLHTHIHHHEHGEEQECSIWQFLVQALITLAVVLVALRAKVLFPRIASYQTTIQRVYFSLPSLRAPPLV